MCRARTLSSSRSRSSQCKPPAPPRRGSAGHTATRIPGVALVVNSRYYQNIIFKTAILVTCSSTFNIVRYAANLGISNESAPESRMSSQIDHSTTVTLSILCALMLPGLLRQNVHLHRLKQTRGDRQLLGSLRRCASMRRSSTTTKQCNRYDYAS